MRNGVAITATAMTAAPGPDTTSCLDAAYDARPEFSLPDWFDSKGHPLGIHQLPRERLATAPSRIAVLLDELQEQLPRIPSDARIYLASTVGAIDILERNPDAPDALEWLRQEVARRFGVTDVRLAAAACASGQIASRLAARAILREECTTAVALGADIVSEFVTSGFGSLGALSHSQIRPYDDARDGLLLGEGAAAIILQENGSARSHLVGWGESCDAAHITAPDLEGHSLATAIRAALDSAEIAPEEIAGIIGHGTGTVYNDLAEVNAIRLVFGNRDVPLFSLKGVTGHTIGAAGLMQLVTADEIARRRAFPPQAGLLEPMPGAQGLVSREIRPLPDGPLLSLNIGFGGLNSAVILQGGNP